MQTNETGPRPFSVLAQAVAYVLGGMFLWDAGSTYATEAPALIGQLFGVAFIGFAFFLAISSFVDRIVACVNRIDMWLFLALFFAAMGSLIKTAVESPERRILYVIVAVTFLSIILAAMLFRLYRTGANLRTELGSRVASQRLLRGLSVALSLFALAIIVIQVDIVGDPILYLAIALVCLGVASLT